MPVNTVFCSHVWGSEMYILKRPRNSVKFGDSASDWNACVHSACSGFCDHSAVCWNSDGQGVGTTAISVAWQEDPLCLQTTPE